MLSKSTSLLAPYGPAQKWVKPRIKCVQLSVWGEWDTNAMYPDSGSFYTSVRDQNGWNNIIPVYSDGVIGYDDYYSELLVFSDINGLQQEVELNLDDNRVVTNSQWVSESHNSSQLTVISDKPNTSSYFVVIAALEGINMHQPYPYGYPVFKQFPITEFSILNNPLDLVQTGIVGPGGELKITRSDNCLKPNTGLPYSYGTIDSYTLSVKCDGFDFDIIGNIQLNYWAQCFTKHTRILLGDHTWKTADQLTVDDIVVCWDFDRGEMTSSPLLWLMKRQLTNQYHKIITNTGRVFENVGNHRLFSLTTNRFERALELLNHDVWTIDGVETIVSIEQCNQSIDYYNAISANHMNLITDGFLSSCGFNNLYPINDMKYIKQPRPKRPIEMYGDIPQSWYTCLRLDEHYCDPTGVKRYIDRCIENAC